MDILSLDGHPNCITGSRITAIVLNWWILPIGRASAVQGPIECMVNFFYTTRTIWRPFKPILNILGPFFTLKDHFLPLRTIWDHIWPFWTMLDYCGWCWIIWDRLGQSWAIAIAICLSHSHLEPFRVIWSHLEPFGASWLYLPPTMGHILAWPYGKKTRHLTRQVNIYIYISIYLYIEATNMKKTIL